MKNIHRWTRQISEQFRIVYLNFDILVDVWSKVIEWYQSEPWDVDAVNLDACDDFLSEIEDGVLVRLDGLGGVDDKHQRRV